ncbi:Fatty acid desaturase [Paraoerskovia marina]|uniref:Fatty acid desaturase n=1 Tax=Paraoerskovia marina TaxID=545619 RepID=A0A1H1MCG9_9CELL|nr:acyl-CoA desaturase [Paraoerskovia marina]SDR84055.1 Fatty acid desaturase [Paraoerskovia marina]
MPSTSAPAAAPSHISTYTELSKKVRDAGLLARTPVYYAVLLTVLGIALAGCIAGFVLLGASWFQLLIAGALGIVLTQFSFVAHEAAHRQVYTSGPRNDLLGRILANGVAGISYTWWMNKHSRHHANPNKVGKDPDIDMDAIVFTTESAQKYEKSWLRHLHRRQGWLFFPLLTLEGINLHITSIRSAITMPRGGRKNHRASELWTIGLRLSIYVALVVWLLPLGIAAAFLGVQLAVYGVYMGASFAPNHKGMEIIGRETTLDFFRRQVVTSRNIRGGKVMDVLMGGLNLQIEHHLFPSMPRPHLAAARRLVRQHSLENGVPYTETSLVQSYVIVIRYLNRVGLGARDPFDCPPARALRGPLG